jgi:predicted metal-dependent peptidase
MKKPMQSVPVDAAVYRKWIETRSALLWRAPAFTHILFSMLNPTKGELAALFTTEVPIAATDGTNLILNPETFFKMKLDERVFVVAHEILHCVFNHCIVTMPMKRSGKVKYPDGTALPYDHALMNAAMDYVINDTLVHDNVGRMPTDVDGKQVGLHDPSIADRNTSFVDSYRKLYEDLEKNGGKAPSGFDALLEPGSGQGQDPAQAAQQRSQTEWDTAVAAALASAKLQGKLGSNLERLLSEIVDPTVPWHEHIRATLARRIGGGGYDWRKPDRRLIQRDIYAPQRSGNGCGTLVVGCDTSGSIGQPELNAFFAEMRGILDDLRPEQVHIVWCDAKVHKVDTVEDAMEIDALKPHGGGGTDFRPVFEWIDNEAGAIDGLIYLTDGYGSFPDQPPPYPVIWGDIHGSAEFPWGDVVHVDVKK